MNRLLPLVKALQDVADVVADQVDLGAVLLVDEAGVDAQRLRELVPAVAAAECAQQALRQERSRPILLAVVDHRVRRREARRDDGRFLLENGREVRVERLVHEVIFRVDDDGQARDRLARDRHNTRLQERRVVDEIVPAEVRRLVLGRAARRQRIGDVVRRGDVEAVILQRAADLVRLEIEYVEAQVLVGLAEVRDVAVHLDVAERPQDADIELSGLRGIGRLQVVDNLVQAIHPVRDAREEDLPRLRQVAAALRALDERDAERALEVLHLRAEGRLRDVRLLGRSREVLHTPVDNEAFQLLDAWQISHHKSLPIDPRGSSDMI